MSEQAELPPIKTPVQALHRALITEAPTTDADFLKVLKARCEEWNCLRARVRGALPDDPKEGSE